MNLISTLLKEKDHWLPSKIDLSEHCDTDTTNHVEGFFGVLKDMADHASFTFQLLVRSIFIISKRFTLNYSKILQKILILKFYL